MHAAKCKHLKPAGQPCCPTNCMMMLELPPHNMAYKCSMACDCPLPSACLPKRQVLQAAAVDVFLDEEASLQAGSQGGHNVLLWLTPLAVPDVPGNVPAGTGQKWPLSSLHIPPDSGCLLHGRTRQKYPSLSKPQT